MCCFRFFFKVLTNRLKDVMPHIISEHHSAFLSDHLIFDNILVAFKTLHHMRNHNKGKTGFMALKLNISKAYDRVEWSYMEKVLVKMGFQDRWVKLMMLCITTTSYSILINGEPRGDISLTKGLPQRDPLFPYLFLMCTEGLHGLIRKADTKGDIQGVSLCQNGPKLTRLLFADDNLIFGSIKESECQSLLDALATYERASGQQINQAKTTLFFSKSTIEDMQTLIIYIYIC